MNNLKDFWSKRYQEKTTAWDLGTPSPPLTTYFDQLEEKQLTILIPGAGAGYEAEYLYNHGFVDTHVLDVAPEPLALLAERTPSFPKEQLIQGDFFAHVGQYDLIIEQTFFCSFPPLPATRHQYAQQMHDLLKPGGKLVGLWFDIPLTGDMGKRPFGGNKKEYLDYLTSYFEVETFERCYNSIPARSDMELFGIFRK